MNPASAAGREWSDLTQALIASRQHVAPRRLVSPGPDPAQIRQLFVAAAAAPDHGQITPWRFVVIDADQRPALGQAFADALLERDPSANAEQQDEAREKALRAPFLALAIARLGPDSQPIADAERLVSLGCALQNLLLAANAMDLGSGLTSGQALGSQALRRLFNLQAGELAVCFVAVGTVAQRKPMRPRPDVTDFVSMLRP